MNLIPRPATLETRPGSCAAATRPAVITNAALPPEGYRLEIAPGGIRIAAAGEAGFFYARQTLAQLADEYGAALPCLLIEDRPRFAWRGAMLDSCRNFQSVSFIKKFLELMAFHKLNRFHWHLNDDQAWRLDIPALPELAAVGGRRRDGRYEDEQWKEGRYRPADVAEVVAHARSLHIEVIPEIDVPGHARALLASHPELSCRGLPLPVAETYGVHPEVLCAGNDAVFDLLDQVFGAVARLFPSPWIHAGGDECPTTRWAECPRCQARAQAEGVAIEHGLQGWFMERIAAIISRHGKKMIGWDELMDGPRPADTAIMSWRGYEGGQRAVREGHPVIMCPQTKACYLDHFAAPGPDEAGQLSVCTLEDSYRFDPHAGIAPEHHGLVLGAQANLWTEQMYAPRLVEYMAFPRLCALAEVFWSSAAGRDFPEFKARLRVHRDRLDRRDVSYNPTLFR